MVNKAHKKYIEMTYNDVCNVYEHIKTRDEKSKQTKTKRTLVHELLPCRMSFGTFVRPSGDEVTSNLTLSVVLFLSPDIEIKAGSEFEVERNVLTNNNHEMPRIVKLKNSSPPYVYPTHQEITCSILEDYA